MSTHTHECLCATIMYVCMCVCVYVCMYICMYVCMYVYMLDHLHWLALIARMQLKVLTLIYPSHIGQAPRYLRDLIRLPSAAISLRPLRSLDRHDLYVPRARTAM